jgi:hypothetical protein
MHNDVTFGAKLSSAKKKLYLFSLVIYIFPGQYKAFSIHIKALERQPCISAGLPVYVMRLSLNIQSSVLIPPF